MVYIHGGGYYLHNAEEFPPNYLMERDIVLVVVQYRLDILGKYQFEICMTQISIRLNPNI